jgi:hypothetical protein
MDLYEKMGDELRLLFYKLKQGKDFQSSLAAILAAAHQMGEPILTQANELKKDLDAYLLKPAHIRQIEKHIQRLEQQTRDL